MNQWRNCCFSLDAQVVVNDITSSKEPLGWFTRDAILYARSTLAEKGWSICWNDRNANKFADYMAKLALKRNCNDMYFSFNSESLPKVLSDIYVVDLVDCSFM